MIQKQSPEGVLPKHLCQSLFFNKVADLRSFIKKGTLSQVFSCEFCEIFKNTFFNWTPPVAASDDNLMKIYPDSLT